MLCPDTNSWADVVLIVVGAVTLSTVFVTGIDGSNTGVVVE